MKSIGVITVIVAGIVGAIGTTLTASSLGAPRPHDLTLEERAALLTPEATGYLSHVASKKAWLERTKATKNGGTVEVKAVKSPKEIKTLSKAVMKGAGQANHLKTGYLAPPVTSIKPDLSVPLSAPCVAEAYRVQSLE